MTVSTNPAKEWINTPGRRVWLHGVSVSLIAFLAFFFHVDWTSWAILIPAAIVAGFDMISALANSKSNVRTLFYGLVLTLQPIGLALAIGTEAQWAAGLQLLSAILGSALATVKTIPVPPVYGEDEYTETLTS